MSETTIWTEPVPREDARLREIDVTLRRLRDDIRRCGRDGTLGQRIARDIAALETEAAPLRADYDARRADYDARLAAYLEASPAHDGRMSSHGTDLAARGQAAYYESLSRCTPARTAPGDCPRCGGPTAVHGQPCDGCDD